MKPYVIILILMASAFIPEVIYIFRLFGKGRSRINLPRVTQRVNGVLFFIGVFLIGVAVLYDVNYLNYKTPIHYSNWKKITLADFKAIKRPNYTLDGSERFAYISTEMKCKITKDEVEINTLFHPSRSYTFNENYIDESLLTHELYHLHITEYFSRLVRKEIVNKIEKFNRYEAIQIMKKYQHNEREYQKQYDNETYHGYVLNQQRKWQQKVDSCLLHLEQYTDTTIKF